MSIFQAPTNPFEKKDDFSELPPNQRRKKLQAKIEEITGKVSVNPTSFNKKKSPRFTKGEKNRQSLLTFQLSSSDLASI